MSPAPSLSTCTEMSSVSRAVGSSGDDTDLRLVCSLQMGTQRTLSKVWLVFTSFRVTMRMLPCLSLMGSKKTCPRSWMPRSPCTRGWGTGERSGDTTLPAGNLAEHPRTVPSPSTCC